MKSRIRFFMISERLVSVNSWSSGLFQNQIPSEMSFCRNSRLSPLNIQLESSPLPNEFKDENWKSKKTENNESKGRA